MNHLQLFKQTNITRCLVSEFYERGNGLRFFYNLLWFTSWKNLQIWETLAYDCTFYTCHVPCKCFPLWKWNTWFRLLILFYVDLWKKNWSTFLSSVKNFAWRTCGKIFLEAIFKSFFTKFPSLFYVISLAKKISYFLSANHSSELWCFICDGVTLFQPVLHLNCTAFSQSESSIFFHVYYQSCNAHYLYRIFAI